MYYYHTNDEIDEIGEGIIRKYNYQAFIQGDPTDIEGFIADHLNYRIVYDRLADKDAGRMAFLADGKDTKIRRALSDTGKEKSFGVACAVALLLMILGCVGAIVIGNPFLAPVLAIALAMIPFLYLLRTVEQYEEQVKLELETGLSAITSSYERTMNLKSAVEENIDNLKPPVKGLFQSFLVEISVINPDVKAAICHLRERVKDCVWEEWCDTLISCQDDSQLIGTLYPVVEKLTDMRIVNAELKVMISENKREYYIMALMVVANIPLLYFLNKEWYGALMYTTFGKVTLAICGAVMLFTFLRMQKYCKPVEYRR